jgi:predicted acetyltransferase
MNLRAAVAVPGVTLRRAGPEDETEVLAAYRATASDYPEFLHYYQDAMTFARYLEVLDEQERGVGLPPLHVPTTFLFAFVDGRVVGRASIRHFLNEILLRVNGHIGYVVVPEFRRRGYATEILRQSLEVVRDRFGVGRALVTCDDDNVGSIRTIEKNGGVLENVLYDPARPKPKRRYWIETGPPR